LHSNVFVAKHTYAGNYVFIYPHVVITDDPHPPSEISKGATIEDFAQIAAGSVLMSGVKIGKHALVAANSLVIKDVDEYDLVAGQPARLIKKVTEVRSRIDGESYYPWPLRFSRGMPWADQGYETWLKDN
jgi:acetyltransferase-like isoleucine patch superfamily enzyme